MKLIRYNQSYPATWSSFDRISPLRDLLESALQLAGTNQPAGEARGWTPSLDLTEDEEHLIVELEAAGLKKEDFEISLHGDALTVSGERRAPADEGESFRSERFFGKFSRSLELPMAVTPDGVSATYADGVLTVRLPKAEASKPRKIDVQVS